MSEPEERTIFGSYLGEFHRRVYRCRACGTQSWVEEAATYGSKKSRDNQSPRNGIHRKQYRGMYDLCQNCYEVDLRLIKILKDAGYTHVGRDEVQYDGDGIFSMILWFREPTKEVSEL